jgi:hypothetical protein
MEFGEVVDFGQGEIYCGLILLFEISKLATRQL